MNVKSLLRQIPRGATAVLVYLASAKLLIHFLTNGRYGYFRDELYYIACSEHLDFGYVDHPPLIAFITYLSRRFLGDSLFALRFLPALAGAITVWLSGCMARQLGGGRFAQGLAALTVIIAPIYLLIDNFLSMNAFEPLFWLLGAYLVLLVIKKQNPRLWICFGLVAGIGLLNKHSMLFFGFGILAGLILTSHRRFLLDKWLWLGSAAALVIFLPNIFWQLKNGWPTLEFMRNAQLLKNYPVSPLEFILGQILLLHPLAFPIWISGLFFLFVSKDAQKYRILGWTYAAIFSLFAITQAKVYYLAPAYPMLLAAGAVAIERLLERHHWARLKSGLMVVLILGGLVTAPYVLPLLPPEIFPRYAAALGIPEVKTERHAPAKLPQHFADMFGWENMTQTVAQIYHRLSPAERAQCAIYAGNYGEAGAIDFFGQAYGLPKAISGHNNYFLWGPRHYTGEIAIVIGGSMEDLRQSFYHIERVAIIGHEYAMPHEKNLPVYVCRNAKLPLKELWPKTKRYI